MDAHRWPDDLHEGDAAPRCCLIRP